MKAGITSKRAHLPMTDELAEQAKKRAFREKKDLLLTYVDIDGLKTINDIRIIEKAPRSRSLFPWCELVRRTGSMYNRSMTLSTIVLGTGNKDKLRELKHLMRGVRVHILSLKDFPKCPEVIENGKTFVANAEKKARQYSRHTRSLTLADDSGLMVSRLKGAPGVYSARYAGKGCTYTDNNRKLLRVLKNVPAVKRSAKFVCVIAIFDNGRRVKTVRGECVGRIAFEGLGTRGFGYDPVFIPNGYSKTFAELGPNGKKKVSHRSRALRKAKQAILKYIR